MSQEKSAYSKPSVKSTSFKVVATVLAVLVLGFCSVLVYGNCRSRTITVGPNTLAYASGLTNTITFSQSEGLVVQGGEFLRFSLKNLQTGEIVKPHEAPLAIGEDHPRYLITDLQPGTYWIRSGNVLVYSIDKAIDVTVKSTVFSWIGLSLANLAIGAVIYVMFFKVISSLFHI